MSIQSDEPPSRELLESEDCPQPYDDSAQSVQEWEAALEGNAVQHGETWVLTIKDSERAARCWISSDAFFPELKKTR